jgi:uncharacterized metal-binding protein
MKPNSNSNLVFVCSGAADVGELTDRAARQLSRQGSAAMSCLAGIAARDPDMLCHADLTPKTLVIDGCPRACASGAFREAGLNRFLSLNLAELGLKKGASPVTPERIQTVVNRAVALLSAPVVK